MVIVLNPVNNQFNEVDLEVLVTKVFLKSIDLIWWLKKLAEYRTLTWLPSLARSAFVVVLHEEYIKSELEIAEYVGLTKNTVRNILRADPQLAIYKLQHLEELTAEQKKELKVHIAWWIAKVAYKLIKQWEEPSVAKYFAHSTAVALDIPWAYMLLKRLKGHHFPIEKVEDILNVSNWINVSWIPLEEILKNIDFPIVSPADLLHKIKEYVKMKNYKE